MNKFALGLFAAIVATLFVQIAVYETASSNNTLNLYHLLIAGAFLLTFRLRPSISLTPETLFFVVLATTSVLGWALFGLNLRAVLLPLILMTFSVGVRWHRFSTPEIRTRVYRNVFLFVVVAILVRNVINFDSLFAIYGRVRSETPAFFLASGGRNLEATQLGMLATLLIGTSFFFPAITVALLTSLLMMSRSGLLAVFVAMLLWLFHGRFSGFKFYIGAVSLSLGILGCFATLDGAYRIPIIERFDMTVEKDLAADNQGRLAIWSAALEVLKENPLGHGVGNGFPTLNEHLGGHLRENNAHNVLVEFALDGGLQTSLLFVLIMFSTLRSPKLIDSPEQRFALTYGVLALVEYTGYDAIGWFFIGASYAARHISISSPPEIRLDSSLKSRLRSQHI
ncbi:MAG: O-antigen ligase family protein [Novipirellula sp. JB048]